MKPTRVALTFLWLILSAEAAVAQDNWQPAKGPLTTRWAKDVSPKNAHPEYPRPQMVRKDWQNLNGLWDYAIRPKTESQPSTFDGKILVPFPIESALSGVRKPVGEESRLWYRRSFTVPKGWSGQRVLLQFGAVDWEAMVFVNGKELGSHRGGYDAFSLDITGALKPSGPQEIVVSAWDPTDAGPQPRGKQVGKPGGIWYTPTSGIWQTVWLEPVASTHIRSVKITPDFDRSAVTILAHPFSVMGSEATLKAEILDGRKRIQTAELTTTIPQGGGSVRISLNVPRVKPWTPDAPYLYGLRMTLLADGR